MIQSQPSASRQQTQSENDIIKKSNGVILANDESDSDEDRSKSSPVVNRKKYGNMVVLSRRLLITLGPDYLCFIPTFIAFSIVSYFLIILVFDATQILAFRLVTLVMCIGQPLSYLLLALSNPGIITESHNQLSAEDRKKCSKCSIVVPRNARHCRDCDVCIEHYDHHCPWSSKCIGGGNMVRFYVFLGWTPIYLIFVTIAFVACMSSNLIKIQQIPPQL